MDQTQLLYPRSHHGLGDLQQPQMNWHGKSTLTLRVHQSFREMWIYPIPLFLGCKKLWLCYSFKVVFISSAIRTKMSIGCNQCFLLVTHSEINAWDGKPLITQFLVYIIIICMVIDPLRN